MKKFKGSLYLYSGAVNDVDLAFAFYRDAFDARFMKNHEGGGLQMEIFGYDAYIIQLDRLVVLCFSYLFFSFPEKKSFMCLRKSLLVLSERFTIGQQFSRIKLIGLFPNQL